MKQKIKPNILILYSVIFSVAFIIGGFILQYNTEQITRRSLDLNSRAVASFYLHNQVQDIIKNVIVIESKVRGFVITGDKDFIQGVQDTLAQLKYKLISLKDGAREHFKEASFALLASLIDKRSLPPTISLPPITAMDRPPQKRK
jgi:CHASE3 domain.